MKDIAGKEIIDITFMRGSNVGGIHNRNSDGTFGAFTATISRSFKTLKGARNFLESRGYCEVK